MRPARTLPRLGSLVVVIAVVASLAGPVGASNDTYFDRQWALAQIRASEAWARSTGTGVTIGIVDTGVDAAHPDLAGKVLATADCIGRPCTLGGGQDTHGHGTIISGIAAATANNGVGVAGVAPDARLVVAKVLNSNGEGRVGDINNGIRWVVDQGARVVNLSLGDPNVSVTGATGTPLRSGIEYAWSRGAVPVLASGNYGTGSGDIGSGTYGNVNALVVGATTRTGAVPAYSGGIGTAKWGLVAPGGAGSGGSADSNVLSTFPLAAGGSGYATSAGTSMAAPHVAGAVALLLAQGLSPGAAVARLLATLQKSSSSCGSGCQGRLDVAAAVGSGPGAATPPPTVAAPATSGGASATTVPRTTVPRATRAPTTTLPPTTVPPTTVPPTTVPAEPPSSSETDDPSELAAPLPGAVQFVDGSTRPHPAAVAFAAVLVLAMAGAVGSVGVRRLRPG